MKGLPQFLRFCLVGGVGFVADTAGLYLLSRAGGLDLYSARALSFIIAATLTWGLNRRFTFAANRKASGKEWGQYILVNGAGALVNYGAYALAISILPLARAEPVIAVAIGSALALFVNFFANKHLVFRP